MSFFIKRGEKVQGPFSREQIVLLAKAKKIKGSDGIGNSSKGPFQELSTVWKSFSDPQSEKAKPGRSQEDIESPVPAIIALKKSITGSYSVHYDCPACGERLISPLEDAGDQDECPDCQKTFTVPGTKQREKHERIKLKKQQEKDVQADLKKRKKQEAAQAKQEAARVKQEAALAQQREEAERSARSQPSPPPSEAPHIGTSEVQTPSARTPRRGEIICPNPNCGFIGQPKRVARGSCLIGLILCLCFLLPGVLYLVFMQGYRYVCPRCGIQIREGGHY